MGQRRGSAPAAQTEEAWRSLGQISESGDIELTTDFEHDFKLLGIFMDKLCKVLECSVHCSTIGLGSLAVM